MNKHTIVIMAFIISLQAYELPELKVSTGPGWAFSYVRLLPTPFNPAEGSFLGSINDQTSWNLFACLAGEAAYKLPYNFSVSTEVEGNWLRHGKAVITDSAVKPVADVSLDSITILLANALKVQGQMDYSISLPDKIKLIIGGGYVYVKEFERFTFLNQPLTIFSQVHYKGPYIHASVSRAFENIRFSLGYTLIIGKTKVTLTQTPNPFNEIVRRFIPDVLGNIFTLALTYRYSENLSFSEKIKYGNKQNHKTGRSITYQKGHSPVTLCNVDSITGKELLFLTSITYEF